MFKRVKSASIEGIEATEIDIEVDATRGIPSINIIGLAQGAAKESKDRAIHTLSNSGIKLPPKKITISLAPAEIKKTGSGFDLPIAIGLAALSLGVDFNTEGFLFASELSLDGKLKPIKGIFPMGILARKLNYKLVVSKENKREASLTGAEVFGFSSFLEVLSFLEGKIEAKPETVKLEELILTNKDSELDFADVKGQFKVKRAVVIAASGFHNLLMVGSPGVGKSMIAKRIPTILPDMTKEEILETTKIYSVCGLLSQKQPIITNRPYRAPHSGSSDVSLIGGGANAMPGEITLAHNGVLFLDEFPEFKRNVIESLRQPMEDGVITISRSNAKVTYPARFLLVAAANPCPCGYYGSRKRECTCTIQQIKKYRNKISGPILDRIDIQINIPEVDYEKLSSSEIDMDSKSMKELVQSTIEIQRERFKDDSINYNSQMGEYHLKKYCSLSEESHKILKIAVDRFGFSARSYSKILKIARTIADIEKESSIQPKHIKEAISYRALDWDV